jgi:hypothetical protein
VVPAVDPIQVHVYKVTLDRKAVLTVDAKSQAFDGALLLLDRNLDVLAADDDSGGDSNPKIEILLNAGEYTVLVTTLDNNVGAFDIAAASRDPRTCTASPIGTDATVTGTIEESDCRLRDFIPGVTEEPLADVYTLTLSERRRTTIDVGSSAFVAMALPLTENYELIEDAEIQVARDRGVTTFRAGPGTYRLAIISLTDLGTYVVKTSTQAP